MDEPVFVAPHYDDVALSCGGQVAQLARAAAPVILTVFGGEPAIATTRFARFQHRRWGLDEASVVAQRRAEERCAAAALGAGVQTRWLDELDAIYRQPAYDSDAALFGRLLPEDTPTLARVTDALAALGAPELYVPLGVGNHVDHQLVFRAGQQLAARGGVVWAYADVPYALDAAALAARLTLGGVSAARDVSLDDDAWARKLAAVACYASQLPVLFRKRGDWRAALTAGARAVGGGRVAERVWRVLPGADPWIAGAPIP